VSRRWGGDKKNHFQFKRRILRKRAIPGRHKGKQALAWLRHEVGEEGPKKGTIGVSTRQKRGQVASESQQKQQTMQRKRYLDKAGGV